MTNKETIERKNGLTFDYVNFLIYNPAMVENLSGNFKLEIIEKDFPRKDTMKLKKAMKQPQKTIRVLNTLEFIL